MRGGGVGAAASAGAAAERQRALVPRGARGAAGPKGHARAHHARGRGAIGGDGAGRAPLRPAHLGRRAQIRPGTAPERERERERRCMAFIRLQEGNPLLGLGKVAHTTRTPWQHEPAKDPRNSNFFLDAAACCTTLSATRHRTHSPPHHGAGDDAIEQEGPADCHRAEAQAADARVQRRASGHVWADAQLRVRGDAVDQPGACYACASHTCSLCFPRRPLSAETSFAGGAGWQTLRSAQCQTAKESHQLAAQAALEHLSATVVRLLSLSLSLSWRLLRCPCCSPRVPIGLQVELKARMSTSSASPRAESDRSMHLFAKDRKSSR